MRVTTLLIVALAACSAPGSGGPAATPAPPTNEQAEQSARLIAEADALFAGRADRETLAKAIATYERALAADPTNVRTCEMLARAAQLYGQVHLRGAPAEERSSWFEKGQGWAEQGLFAQSPRYARLRSDGVDIDDAIAVLEPASAPLVYWYATNLGSYANAMGRAAGIKYKDRIVRLNTWVFERAPAYHFRGPDRFFGAYYAAVPTFLGGDLGKSEQHFTDAIAGAPQFSGNYLIMAEFYATASGNRALFDELIGKVQAMTPCADGGAPCVIDGWEPESEFDRKRAGELAGKADQLF